MSREHPELEELLREAELNDVRLWRYDDVFALTDQQTEDQRLSILPQRVPQTFR